MSTESAPSGTTFFFVLLVIVLGLVLPFLFNVVGMYFDFVNRLFGHY